MKSYFSFVREQFVSSARCLRRTQTLTTVGVLLAIQILLSTFGVFQVTEGLKISLAHLAVAPTALLFGPLVAAIQGALSDFIGFILRPNGPYFPGFTLTAALCGMTYGLFYYHTQPRLPHIIASRAVVIIVLNILLNTIFLGMLYGPAQWAALPVRALKNIVQLPIDCILLTVVLRTASRLRIQSPGR